MATAVLETMIQIRADEAHKRWLDELRRNEPDIPSRAEMARRLIERAGKRLDAKRTS